MQQRACRVTPAAAAGVVATLLLHLGAGLLLAGRTATVAMAPAPPASPPMVLVMPVTAQVPMAAQVPAAAARPAAAAAPAEPGLPGPMHRLPAPPPGAGSRPSLPLPPPMSADWPSPASSQLAQVYDEAAVEPAVSEPVAGDSPAALLAAREPATVMPVLPVGWGWRSAQLRGQPAWRPPDCRQVSLSSDPVACASR